MKGSHCAWVAPIVCAAAVATATLTTAAAGFKIDLPSETTALKAGPNLDLVNGQCLTCHSGDYITTQPRDKPLAFWKAEVEKMKKVYGAQIQDDQIEPIAEYLAKNYGSGK